MGVLSYLYVWLYEGLDISVMISLVYFMMIAFYLWYVERFLRTLKRFR